MSRNTEFYSQVDHQVSISPRSGGGTAHVIKDFFQDDCITWEYINSDKVQATEGLDGVGLSVAAGRAAKVTVMLKPTSPSVGYITRLFNTLNSAKPIAVDVTISTGVKEVHRLSYAFATPSGGANTGGPTMSARTFVFTGKELTEDESQG